MLEKMNKTKKKFPINLYGYSIIPRPLPSFPSLVVQKSLIHNPMCHDVMIWAWFIYCFFVYCCFIYFRFVQSCLVNKYLDLMVGLASIH